MGDDTSLVAVKSSECEKETSQQSSCEVLLDMQNVLSEMKYVRKFNFIFIFLLWHIVRWQWSIFMNLLWS